MLLQDKLKFLTDNVVLSLKTQQDAANKQDIEFKNLSTALTQIKNTY